MPSQPKRSGYPDLTLQLLDNPQGFGGQQVAADTQRLGSSSFARSQTVTASHLGAPEHWRQGNGSRERDSRQPPPDPPAQRPAPGSPPHHSLRVTPRRLPVEDVVEYGEGASEVAVFPADPTSHMHLRGDDGAF